jgi:class 3 adenylate cyclase
MNRTDRVLTSLFPSLILAGTPWSAIWADKERRDFVFLARLVYPLVAVAYVLHYFMFDRAVGLEPIDLWFRFRMSMATFAGLIFAFYLCHRCCSIRYYKLPAMIAGAVICYFQGKVLLWYEGSVYFYAFAFVILNTIILKSSIPKSLAYALFLIAIQWNLFIEAGLETPLLYSATAITLMFVTFARSGYLSEIRYFAANQQNIETQTRIIEMNVEFTDRLRAFLPKEIAGRLFRYVEEQKMSILQAIEEVLRPKARTVSCLFSDIRGFTKSTRNVDDFLNDAVIPNVKECTDAVEANGGIPRKIGDLIFAYFDHPDPVNNLAKCLNAGFDLIEANKHFNESRDEFHQIRRHVLISTGDAIVGNLGGFDSSIEITALGNPVNFLSRVDEITKHQRVRPLLIGNELVLDDESASCISSVVQEIQIQCLDLHAIDVSIRDFEETAMLWILRNNQVNRDAVQSILIGEPPKHERQSSRADETLQATGS